MSEIVPEKTPDQITQDLLFQQLKCLQSLKYNIQFMTVILILVIVGYIINFIYMIVVAAQ